MRYIVLASKCVDKKKRLYGLDITVGWELDALEHLGYFPALNMEELHTIAKVFLRGGEGPPWVYVFKNKDYEEVVKSAPQLVKEGKFWSPNTD